MANTQRSNGDNLQIIAPSTLVSGTPILVGSNLFGVPMADAASGAAAVLQVKGTFALPKVGGVAAFTLGAKVFWSQSTGKATAVATDVQVGVCAIAAGINDTSVVARIDGFIKEPVDADAIAALVGADGVAVRTSATTIGAGVYGTLIVLSGGATGTSSVGASFNAKPVLATIQVPGVNTRFILTAVVAAGVLTVTLSGDPGVGGATVSFLCLP